MIPYDTRTAVDQNQFPSAETHAEHENDNLGFFVLSLSRPCRVVESMIYSNRKLVFMFNICN